MNPVVGVWQLCASTNHTSHKWLHDAVLTCAQDEPHQPITLYVFVPILCFTDMVISYDPLVSRAFNTQLLIIPRHMCKAQLHQLGKEHVGLKPLTATAQRLCPSVWFVLVQIEASFLVRWYSNKTVSFLGAGGNLKLEFWTWCYCQLNYDVYR